MVEVRAELTATVWKSLVEEGQAVEKGEKLMILESMKMEIDVIAPRAGTVDRLAATPDAVVNEGDLLVVLAEADS